MPPEHARPPAVGAVHGVQQPGYVFALKHERRAAHKYELGSTGQRDTGQARLSSWLASAHTVLLKYYTQ